MLTEKPRRILITAGNTQVPIDKVRCISNIFKGRTGTQIAEYLANMGHSVVLLTSNLSLADKARLPVYHDFQVVDYKTYDDLLRKMKRLILNGDFDTIIHSAAVSDYYVDGVCVEEEIAPDSGPWTRLVTIDSTKKVGSDHECLYLRMRPTQKIIDLIREPWGFNGTLVKFKLQVGMTDDELIAIAGKSMRHSNADAIVANCLEWSTERAIIITPENEREIRCVPVGRHELPAQLAETLERIWEKKT